MSVAVIKAHRNRKMNLNAKTNPNPDLQKTCKKKLKEKRKKITARTGFEPVRAGGTQYAQCEHCTTKPTGHR